MVIADFVIIALRQHRRIKKPLKSILIEAKKRRWFSRKIYADGFPVAQALMGWWYTFYPPDSLIYTDPFFDIKDSEQRDDVKNVVIRAQWEKIIIYVLDYYLSMAETGTIAILFRLNNPVQEVIHCACSYEFFVNELLNGKIHFDELYFVSKGDAHVSRDGCR